MAAGKREARCILSELRVIRPLSSMRVRPVVSFPLAYADQMAGFTRSVRGNPLLYANAIDRTLRVRFEMRWAKSPGADWFFAR
jgi:hypothetical protein